MSVEKHPLNLSQTDIQFQLKALAELTLRRHEIPPLPPEVDSTPLVEETLKKDFILAVQGGENIIAALPYRIRRAEPIARPMTRIDYAWVPEKIADTDTILCDYSVVSADVRRELFYFFIEKCAKLSPDHSILSFDRFVLFLSEQAVERGSLSTLQEWFGVSHISPLREGFKPVSVATYPDGTAFSVPLRSYGVRFREVAKQILAEERPSQHPELEFFDTHFLQKAKSTG